MQSQLQAKRDGTWPDGTTTPAFISASGGCVTTTGDYKIHTFLASGTLTICGAGAPWGSSTVDYMVVAGGGGGSAPPGLYGGGGGAGGFRESPGTASGCYSVSPLGAAPAVALPVGAGPYAITVGAGGAVRTPGDDSTFSTITSTGGGTGGISYNPGAGGTLAAGAGGSGGGIGNWPSPVSPVGAGNSPPTNPAQGNPGAGSSVGGGGGGGATAAGSGGPGPGGGPGGAGATTSISGSPVTYAGGGGGAAWKAAGGTGGPGGGGNGATGGTCAPTPAPQTSGGTNTGGGGGSGGSDSGSGPACNSKGGPGIVIIRYKYQ